MWEKRIAKFGKGGKLKIVWTLTAPIQICGDFFGNYESSKTLNVGCWLQFFEHWSLISQTLEATEVASCFFFGSRRSFFNIEGISSTNHALMMQNAFPFHSSTTAHPTQSPSSINRGSSLFHLFTYSLIYLYFIL